MRKNKFLTIFIIFLVSVFSILSSCTKSAKYDIAILKGKIVAGDGNPWYKADIGIKNKKIVFIGNINEQDAEEIINAEIR